MKAARACVTPLLCGLLVLGCEDAAVSSSDGGSTKGGAPDANVDSLDEAIDALEETDEQLASGLDGLRAALADAGAAIDALDEAVNELMTTPEPCEGDACMLDAIARVAEYLTPMVVAQCENMALCCSEAQIAQYFGPAITTVDECIAYNMQQLEHGRGAPFDRSDVLTAYAISPLVAWLVSGGTKLVEDESVMDACVAHIRDRKCVAYEDFDYACDDEAYFEAHRDPCALANFIEGTRDLNEPCDRGGAQCKPELDCVGVHSGGVCGRLPAEDDLCTNDRDCMPHGSISAPDYDHGLFCNRNVGRCERYRQLGEECEILKRFQFAEAFDDYEIVECDERLSCHPELQVCVASCSEGAFCNEEEGSCGPDLVCIRPPDDFGAWGNRYGGHCREPLAVGSPCVQASDCASGACGLDPGQGREACLPSPTAVGEPCTLDEEGVGQSDAGCAHGWCAADGVCAALCAEDMPCEDGRMCIETFAGEHCDVPVADGQSCVTPVGVDSADHGCASGFCDGDTCGAKADADGACPSERSAQCPIDQYCDAGTCADLVALEEDCSVDAACGAAYCAAAGPNVATCRAYAGAGAACDASNDVRCAPGLDCTAVGEASACYAAGAYPTGASCLYDGLCASGWCDVGTCRALLEEGMACEPTAAGARCAEGLLCFEAVCSPTSPRCSLSGQPLAW